MWEEREKREKRERSQTRSKSRPKEEGEEERGGARQSRQRRRIAKVDPAEPRAAPGFKLGPGRAMPDIRARREEVKVRASLPSVVLYVVWGTEVQGCVVLRWGVRCVVREVGGAMCGTEVGNAVCGAEVGYARAERCNDGLVRVCVRRVCVGGVR